MPPFEALKDCDQQAREQPLTPYLVSTTPWWNCATSRPNPLSAAEQRIGKRQAGALRSGLPIWPAGEQRPRNRGPSLASPWVAAMTTTLAAGR